MKFNHLPENGDILWQECPRSASESYAGTNHLAVWRKNPKASMVYMLAIGRGGNGADNASASFGGGGGGSGVQVALLAPAIMVPDELYYTRQTGYSGSVGVFTTRLINDSNFVQAGFVALYAYGGKNATLQAGAAAETSSAVGAIFSGCIQSVYVVTGQAGASGASGSDGASITYPTTGLLVTGGAGGGGSGWAGGVVFPAAPRYGNALGDGSAHGANFNMGAFLPYGGGGGAGVAGGNGGDGGIGCGGGGGGAGVAAGANKGGKGGPGLIVIAQW